MVPLPMSNRYGNIAGKTPVDRGRNAIESRFVPAAFFHKGIIVWMVFVACFSVIMIPLFIVVFLIKKIAQIAGITTGVE